MPRVVIDRLEPLPSARRVRMSDLARERAADRLGGRTVWCATALPAGRGAAHTLRGCLTADGCVVAEELEIMPDEPFRALGGKLDQALRLASALASPTGLGREPGRLGRREQAEYAEGASDGEALAGDRVEPGDVVVLHDALTAALGEALRGRGAHVVWDVPLGTAPAGVAVAATWEFLHPHARAIDAVVMSWTDRAERAAGIEHIAAAMPSAALLATKEVPASGADAQRLHNRGWSTLLADIVDRDRGESVGGTRHARPAVPAR
jgi:hypothetical protein